ncbi:hypothetical protein DFH27DRAFT_554969 [Peziza echinospora]|nr:hypothetical protein DFH27DRAFT_554969 [Peziza echinospora]
MHTRDILAALYTVLTQFRTSPLCAIFVSAAEGESDGAFKVLAEGTQDLAALVGLFATDSVERYAVDYSRGYFAVALSICSLLGILGYARALLKLAMGAQACQHSGFQTAPVRPLAGVAPADRLPSEELITVYYMRREVKDGLECFYLRKKLQHTEESFPCGWTRYSNARQNSLRNFTTPIPNRKVETQWIKNSSYDESYRSNKGIQLRVWSSMILTSAATGLSILPLRPRSGVEYWTWTRVVGSFVLFAALASSSILWSRVYAREQMPTNHERGRDAPDEFAFWHHRRTESLVVVADLQCAGRREEIFNRIASGVCAVFVVIGYVCQYVEIRKVTATQAAIWLGYQAALSLLRIGIWIWDPNFDDYSEYEITGYQPLEPALGRIHGHDLAITWMLFVLYSRNNQKDLKTKKEKFYADGSSPELVYPVKLLARLDEPSMLSLLRETRNIVDNGLSDADIEAIMEHTTAIWRLPTGLLQEWLRIRSSGSEKYAGGGSSISKLHDAVFVNIGGNEDKPWEEGRIVLLPLISNTGRGDEFPYSHQLIYRYRIATVTEPDDQNPSPMKDFFHFISDDSHQNRALRRPTQRRDEGFMTKDSEGNWIGCSHLRKALGSRNHTDLMKEFMDRGDAAVVVKIEERYKMQATTVIERDIKSAIENIEDAIAWEKSKADRTKPKSQGNPSQAAVPPGAGMFDFVTAGGAALQASGRGFNVSQHIMGLRSRNDGSGSSNPQATEPSVSEPVVNTAEDEIEEVAPINQNKTSA